MCPWGPIVGTLTGALFRASIDPATSHFNIRGSGSGQVATDGVQLLVMSNDSGAPSATVSFSYCSPTNHFGINITDYGDSGGTGSLTISTDAGHSYLVATTPLPNGTHIFFGLTDLGVPFSVVFITTTNSYDGIGMDEIYSTPPPPVPGIETARLGTPPNPNVFLPGVTSGPVIGNTWDPVVDHTSFHPAADLDILVVDAQGAFNFSTPWGTLLVTPPADAYQSTQTAGTPFAVPVPLDCALVGFLAYSQVASYAPGDIQLTNALDLVIGNH